jgi:2-amino-4-hydroxy-6-hydroxymethyldihydropteridine diphosphokinase
MQRMRVELPVVLSLGSNLGDRERTIRDAVVAIGRIAGVKVVAASGIVETPALKPDGVDQDAPAYLNAVVAVRSALSPEELLDSLGEIERDNGRERAERWGDRTLDIDIVAIDGLTRSSDRLTIPHPRAAERAFVLAPWLEIDPHAVLPGRGRVSELLDALGDEVRPYPGEPLL